MPKDNTSDPNTPNTPTEVDFPEYPKKTDMKTDGQYYEQEGISFPESLWETPKSERYEELDHGNVLAYFITSYEGEQVFCYVGVPEGASAENPVPGVVLVHGATGTAFYDWVQEWNDRGYAAIAMDTEGRMPAEDTSSHNATGYHESIKPHGPINAAFTDSSKPVEGQWVYHALASVIASTSFLRSLEGVNPDLIGITGVSYGGFLTCLAVGYDDRYSFAAPVYGCLSNAPSAQRFGTYINNNAGAEIWDGLGPLEASRTPILFVNSDADTSFAVDSISRCVQASKYGAVSFIPGLNHGHWEGAEVKEVFAFADEICKDGTPLIHVTSEPLNNELEIAVPEGVSVVEAKQRYTLSTVLDHFTEWEDDSVEVEDEYVFYSTEDFKEYYYISIQDDRGYYVSSIVTK